MTRHGLKRKAQKPLSCAAFSSDVIVIVDATMYPCPWFYTLHRLLETFKMEFFMRRFGGLEGAPPGVAAAAAGLGPNAGMPPTKRARTNAAAAAAAAGGVFDDPAAAGLGGSGSSSVGGPPTTLRQLAPRCRGSGQPVAGFRGGPGAAAAAGGSSSMGGGGGAGLRSEHTPRPVDLGSMVPAEHDYAPREGELAGMGEQEVVALTPGAPRHFMSGRCLVGWLLEAQHTQTVLKFWLSPAFVFVLHPKGQPPGSHTAG